MALLKTMNAFKWLRSLFPKASVFISYAREDAIVAQWLFEELGKMGFAVYLDTRGTLAGERFLTVIIDHLRRCDAVLALVSGHSSDSAWCQAELYYAHALRRTIMPIRIGSDQQLALPAPLDLLQRETQFVPLDKDEDRESVVDAVRQRFRVVRRRARLRWFGRVALVLALAGLLAWGLHSGFSNLMRERERRALVSRIDRAQAVLRRDAMEPQVARFKDDAPLRSRLLAMADDRERPMHTRLNAHILSAALGSRPKRWYLESLAWSSSTFKSGELTDVTFRTGTVNAVDFKDVTFSGVVWNNGPDFSMAGAKFSRCHFHGGQFMRTTVIDSDFVNSTFNGTTLDVTGFGAVRFESRDINRTSDVITDGEVCAFENAIIANCSEPSAPGVIDFRGPKNEVMFAGVVFESCRFRGLIRPSWFTKCSFNRCTFPVAVQFEEITKGDNFLTECAQLDEACP
jgi:uncharacterized protein YjbI with pentapeptide repeats